ncbi:MAG: KEOPS complex subunit Pcc1 [Candidatus Methanoperedens sp.]|nr:KEOPS complex subunit Pcc1 [Candidatus Methanoperedens sp.]MCZ7394204.1 KEOPS complex subunit Pcc1 [Candidatus Methanoperedens sp.]
MKIKGKLTFKGENAGELVNIIARSLAPDNVPGIETIVEENSVTVIFSADKVGTILASVDDYLMNANIATSLSRVVRSGDIKSNLAAGSGQEAIR